MLFPYDTVRPEQDKLLEAVKQAVERGNTLVAHAPTGLGKTAGALTPTLEYAQEHGKIVMFLTSRLTQHTLALETVREMRKKHDVTIPVIDLIGKQHMCLQENVSSLKGKEFAEYCKSMREDGLCDYYERLKTGEQLSPTTKSVLVQIGQKVIKPDEIKRVCNEPNHKLCPYEITMLLAKDSRVIVTDYSYIFNPRIREGFLNRIGKTLQNCILIVDEGHNLPNRVKDLATERITTNTISRAVRELEKFKHDEHIHHVRQLGEALAARAKETSEETYIERSEFLDMLEQICPVTLLVKDLHKAAIEIREEQKSSSAGALAEFIAAWQGEDDGFTRILSVSKNQQERYSTPFWQLSYRCLDPSVVTTPVFDDAYSSVIMSGTLTPTKMFAELLGVPDAELLTLPSPFPHENRLNLVVPKTTTKFKSRSPRMYEQIAETCEEIVTKIPGNVAIFFPSYAILEDVKALLDPRTERTILSEHSSYSKEERDTLLNHFRGHSEKGAILMGVMGGSFSEGVDLPGDELKGVIVVGLPLGKPDLETKALISYYDEKFGKGWEYGYTFPAFNRTLQSAGRCIRSETDKGVIVFLDERYSWENYYKCFPNEWHISLTLRYRDIIERFFA